PPFVAKVRQLRRDGGGAQSGAHLGRHSLPQFSGSRRCSGRKGRRLPCGKPSEAHALIRTGLLTPGGPPHAGGLLFAERWACVRQVSGVCAAAGVLFSPELSYLISKLRRQLGESRLVERAAPLGRLQDRFDLLPECRERPAFFRRAVGPERTRNAVEQYS